MISINDSGFLEKVFQNMPCGAALQQIICDSGGNAVDYVTLKVNPSFCAMLEVESEAVIGLRASDHLSANELRHWLGIFGPVALEERTTRYLMYSPRHRKTLQGTALCPRKGFAFVMIEEVAGNADHRHLGD